MGCGATSEDAHQGASQAEKSIQDALQQHKPSHLEYIPDDDGKTRYSNSSVDFSCQYRPEEFAVDFLELVDYNPTQKVAYSRFRQLMVQQYSFLYPSDVDAVYRYVYYNKAQDYKIPFPQDRFEAMECSCIQFIKLGYIFYRYKDVLKDPRRALFFFMDDGFNLHVDYKQLKRLLRLHFNIDTKNAITLFKCISVKHGFLNYKKYGQMLEYFDRACLTDDLTHLFQGERDEMHAPRDFDKELNLQDIEVFSDISTRKQELARQAEEAQREQRQRDAERRRRKQLQYELGED